MRFTLMRNASALPLRHAVGRPADLFLPAMSRRDPRLNSPAEMLVRFVFAAQYMLFFAGLVSLIFLLVEGSVFHGLASLLCAVGMVGARVWLKRDGRLEACEKALDTMMSGEVVPDEPTGLDALLERRAALEQRRGQPGFDPWEVQAVRREINAYVREHPESARDIDEKLW